MRWSLWRRRHVTASARRTASFTLLSPGRNRRHCFTQRMCTRNPSDKGRTGDKCSKVRCGRGRRVHGPALLLGGGRREEWPICARGYRDNRARAWRGGAGAW